jgi:hypothetical protein
MSQEVPAAALTRHAAQWIAVSQHPRVLHVFQPVVNLINEHGDVLSIVIQALGRGPFSIQLDRNMDLQPLVTAASVVAVLGNTLHVGEIAIDLAPAQPWEPRPAWASAGLPLETYASHIRSILEAEAPDDSMALLLTGSDPEARIQARFRAKAAAGAALIRSGLQDLQPQTLAAGARALAGLGIGLTPAGDDYLVGIMHGLWLTRPEREAASLCQAIHEAADGRTNSLSQAWLAAAARGESGEVWHNLLAAPENQLDDTIRRILPTGHTSGADALAGFLTVLTVEAAR